jgi:hypothetical protein
VVNDLHVIRANIYAFFADRGYTPSMALKVFISCDKKREVMKCVLVGKPSENKLKEGLRYWDLLKRKIRRTDNENSFKIGKAKNTGKPNKKG